MAHSLERLEKPIQSLPTKALSSIRHGTTPNDGMILESAEKHQRMMSVFRAFITDLCQQSGEGHAGSPMGMAAIGIALYKYVMKYFPKNCNYFNRDRFVLSNGYACLWQYTFMHLVGVESMTLDQLKSYHSAKLDSLCPGHPEIENEGVEVTTGPLGQRLSSSSQCDRSMNATYVGCTAGIRLRTAE